MTQHDRGDVVRLKFSPRNEAGDPVDPSTVTLRLRKPWTAEGAGPSVTHDALGEYSAVVALDEPGLWRYRFFSTGTPTLQEEGEMFVRYTVFA